MATGTGANRILELEAQVEVLRRRLAEERRRAEEERRLRDAADVAALVQKKEAEARIAKTTAKLEAERADAHEAARAAAAEAARELAAAKEEGEAVQAKIQVVIEETVELWAEVVSNLLQCAEELDEHRTFTKQDVLSLVRARLEEVAQAPGAARLAAPASESVAPAQAAANGAARPVKAKPEPRPKRATAAKSAKAAPSRTEAA